MTTEPVHTAGNERRTFRSVIRITSVKVHKCVLSTSNEMVHKQNAIQLWKIHARRTATELEVHLTVQNKWEYYTSRVPIARTRDFH